MTDITELAQSLKAAAEKATPGPWRRSSVRFNGITDIANPMEQGNKPHVANASEKRDAEFIALANPANVLVLVEALEKAQAVMNAVVTAAAIRGVRPFDGIDCDPPTLEENAEACGDAMSARIRELEANPPKPHHNGLMQISNELASAKQRIAELESRTVKLPKLKMLEDYLAEVAVEERKQILIGVKLEFHRELSAAGIKVEAE
ncbi:ead/Ea22-like family protein [Klebsiella pneumoniae]|uniref:ead/Ea22-like family protein n=1 Tax=Klebsiella pneumoniae TaxID=573 RepID=UPI0004ED8547|nr:ead/Ea22-like family protein [Klebsiella pneumoniae]AIK83670.1 ead/Ea22-like family protein [Klebsiella pneumoniae subsp. pneumoniae]MDC7854620.1 ead/Ea22-like family protein [Klebsiella pneumoniae]MDW5538569.1 ead/Ea22-like family protein [Klebsiella pneumoniae]ODO64206.1 hypothetical protein BAY44_13950 [Klebsiella pneumoniae]QPW34740.1 ead/Ea22-like family protein [Klebsiella pneumoniae subsp. pneumoniae ATCC 43816]